MFKDTVLQSGYPKDIAQFGHGMPAQSIETAVWWEDVAKTYFFKGDRCLHTHNDKAPFKKFHNSDIQLIPSNHNHPNN